MNKSFTSLNKKSFFSKKEDELYIISGPCGVESREQILKTVIPLAEQPVDLIRAGIWKPRTRPNSFEGIGQPGLEWLKEASEISGLPVAVEVSSSKHVEMCLNAKVDVLWIGARTTVNPFLVQEIADSLKGVQIPIMIKNPVNPDLELWIGAIERLMDAGLSDLAAIHRGFTSYEKIIYRNKPKWELPLELKRRFPSIPVFCDPSHICGNTRLLENVCQIAIDLHFDGLMIESHYCPEKALSDAKQQITPAELGLLLKKLIYRRPRIEDSNFLGDIETFRELIDSIDYELLELLSKRMDAARKIGEIKKEDNVKILQRPRWEEIIRSRLKIASEKNLSKDFIFTLFETIHQEAINQQNIIMNRTENSDTGNTDKNQIS